MFVPTYLPEKDRKRLAEVRSLLESPLDPEARQTLETERAGLQAKIKQFKDCTVEELRDLKHQLFEQYKKHQSIGSRQQHPIAEAISMIEMRMGLMLKNEIEAQAKKKAVEAADASKKSTRDGKVRKSQFQNSWTIPTDSDD